MARFMRQLTQHLCDSLYAASPHSRKHLALRLLQAALQTFAGDVCVAQVGAAAASGSSATFNGNGGLDLPRRVMNASGRACAGDALFQPFCKTLQSAELVSVRTSPRSTVVLPMCAHL